MKELKKGNHYLISDNKATFCGRDENGDLMFKLDGENKCIADNNSIVIKEMNYTKAIPPEGEYLYLTAGKEYDITKSEGNGSAFYIVHDMGMETICLQRGCAHLKGKDWILK